MEQDTESLRVGKQSGSSAEKFHIAVEKEDPLVTGLGPRCGQDRSSYDEDDVREISEEKAVRLLENDKLCTRCAKYYGLTE